TSPTSKQPSRSGNNCNNKPTHNARKCKPSKRKWLPQRRSATRSASSSPRRALALTSRKSVWNRWSRRTASRTTRSRSCGPKLQLYESCSVSTATPSPLTDSAEALLERHLPEQQRQLHLRLGGQGCA